MGDWAVREREKLTFMHTFLPWLLRSVITVLPLGSDSPPWLCILPGGPGSWTSFFFSFLSFFLCIIALSLSQTPLSFFSFSSPLPSFFLFQVLGAEQFPSVTGSRLPCYPLFIPNMLPTFPKWISTSVTLC